MTKQEKSKNKALQVRLPETLYDQIKSDADINVRSLNAQIVYLLNECYGETRRKNK